MNKNDEKFSYTMREKRKAIIKNSSIGFIGQIVTTVFTFVTRSLFIKNIGIELLGLNSTFASVLTALSLAELGFQSAIVYNLYKPLHDNNTGEVNSIMNILKIIYRYVGLFFVVATLLLTPFLRFIVTGIEITPVIYVYFWLQSLSSVFTYFLAYKRAILYADQKEYISKTIDLLFLVIFNIFQCIALIKFKSYIGYLLLKILQTFVSNLAIHFYCTRYYTYLKNVDLDKQKFTKILHDVRNVFASRIASFIYSSTDNLVISAFVSTISVGVLVNYTTILTSLKTLTNSVLSPIIPILGNHLLDENDVRKREKVFSLDTFVRYLMALVIVIPTGILIDDFIVWWVGERMILSNTIVVLLCMDFYIGLVHSASVDFINSAGLFESDKYIEALGAVCNIVVSLIFVQYLGIVGVLIGTVVSQILFWIGRSIIVYKECLRLEMKDYLNYWIKNGQFFIVAIGISICVYFVYSKINIENMIVRFIVGGVVSELVIVATVGIIWGKSEDAKELKRILSKK